jgi:predicted nucleotidyltransferase
MAETTDLGRFTDRKLLPAVTDVPDSPIQHLIPCLADVPGVAAIVLGGSRARGTAASASDYDLALYYGSGAQLDTDRLLEVVKGLVDEADAAAVTSVGDWGPWIVGGGWLTVRGRKVDLLYRSCDAVAQVIDACRAGHVTMDYQPGHPHGSSNRSPRVRCGVCGTWGLRAGGHGRGGWLILWLQQGDGDPLSSCGPGRPTGRLRRSGSRGITDPIIRAVVSGSVVAHL